MRRPDLRPVLIAGWAAAGLALAVLALWPSLDLAVSALFFGPGGRFPLAEVQALVWLRHGLWNASIVLLALAMVGLGLGFRRGRALGLPARVWGFVVGLYLIGPGLIVDLGLKTHWGRARPADVAEFGGARVFTPFWQIAEECARNCSFVSGEGAGAMALGISLWVLVQAAGPRLGRAWRGLGLSLALAVPLVGGALRLVAGRHFLSDTIMAMVLVALVAVVLARCLRVPGALPSPRGGGEAPLA